MQIGKLTNEQLEDIIFKKLKSVRKEVIVKPGLGEDCAVVDMGTSNLVISTDPITGTSKNIGKLIVHISCNDIASNGIEPIGIILTLLAPPSAKIEEIEEIMMDVQREAESINIDILGGHTEVTDAVNRFVLSATAIGRASKNLNIFTKSAKVDDYIILTKSAGLEGVAIIVSEKENELKNVLTKEEIEIAKGFIKNISVLKEGLIGGKIGVNSMHDVTEGGVLGAVYEISQSANLGCSINYEDIFIEDITRKICEYYSVDPLKLMSSGAMLITCPEKLIKNLESELLQFNIKFSIIGKITGNNDRVMYKNGKKFIIDPPLSDELYKIL